MYHQVKTQGFLSHFVKCFWKYAYNGGQPIPYTIIPDGCFDLIIEFQQDQLTKVKLTGVWTQPVDITILPQTKMFALRFKLLAADYLLRYNIKPILNTSVSLPFDFWGIDQMQFDDFDFAVSTMSSRLNLALKQFQNIDTRKLKLFEASYSGEVQSVGAVADEVHWNSRQINRYFQDRFGFPLKTFLSIIRAHGTYREIAKGNLHPTPKYFDQSHFVKEIKKYTGVTPHELHKFKNDRFLQLSTIKPD
ncbi:helix-turn-helix domain-containing protein [Pseudochryseolinea flava]|uniref:AraC family transcriptional regulator n=1 Tax=Pseudochryseolinea flava TaxID=2059302 RepID=A0A364Y5X3_9BACT|nr:AraC family transcriptional regulator [Pseudochryseolinea flava]RAW02232.1 AraC family transcriptional regulator [Pseudochryseolinea flava]